MGSHMTGAITPCRVSTIRTLNQQLPWLTSAKHVGNGRLSQRPFNDLETMAYSPVPFVCPYYLQYRVQHPGVVGIIELRAFRMIWCSRKPGALH
jgi:hypothetical protein